MDQSNNRNPLLDMLSCPAFLVRDGIITQVNRAAQQRLITPDTPVINYLITDASAYQSFHRGSLCLSLQLEGGSCGATVTVANDQHLFCLEESIAADQALAVAAQQLRAPLHSLFSASETHPELQSVQHELYQLHRIIANMSDFPRYRENNVSMETIELTGVFSETLEKAAVLLESADIRLNYTALPHYIVGVANREMIERSVYNLISNAAKYSPKGSTVDARLTVNGNMLYFTVQDEGDGIVPETLSSIYARYLRTPGIEDSRHGVGLGLGLVCATALAHKGTVLIDQPCSGGTRITVTLTITESNGSTLRSPVRIPVNDYAGGRDHGLLELSDVLPGSVYKDI